MRKTLGLSISSILFLYSSLVAAQTCPDPTVTQPKPASSDWAISSYGGSVTSSGVDARTQQLRVDQEKVASSISRNFRHRKSDGVFDHWFFGSRYLKHVIEVSPKAIFSPGDQPPIQRFQGIGIGVRVDKGQYLDEVGREVPSKIDGITVEVVPPDANATDLMQGEGH